MADKYKIIHHRDECIGCSACASVCPKYWEMDGDGKSNVKGARREDQDDGKQREYLGENDSPLTEDFEGNMEAAESCPVNCIHLFEIKDDNTDNKLI